MAKLGYTWYPKDWKTNEKVFNLTLEMRGFYRELIDYAYENDNRFTINKRFFCRMMNINTRRFDTLFARLYSQNLIISIDGIFQIPSVEPRVQLIRGGKKGGETSKPPPKPNPKPDSNQREKETKSKREKESKINNKKVFNFRKELLAFGFKENLVDDWLKVRKTKRATNTSTAFRNFIIEIHKSNLDYNIILEKCVTNSWAGFKNDWLEKEKSSAKKENKSLAEIIKEEHGLE